MEFSRRKNPPHLAKRSMLYNMREWVTNWLRRVSLSINFRSHATISRIISHLSLPPEKYERSHPSWLVFFTKLSVQICAKCDATSEREFSIGLALEWRLRRFYLQSMHFFNSLIGSRRKKILGEGRRAAEWQGLRSAATLGWKMHFHTGTLWWPNSEPNVSDSLVIGNRT